MSRFVLALVAVTFSAGFSVAAEPLTAADFSAFDQRLSAVEKRLADVESRLGIAASATQSVPQYSVPFTQYPTFDSISGQTCVGGQCVPAGVGYVPQRGGLFGGGGLIRRR